MRAGVAAVFADEVIAAFGTDLFDSLVVLLEEPVERCFLRMTRAIDPLGGLGHADRCLQKERRSL